MTQQKILKELQKILQELQHEGLTNYQILARKTNFSLYPQLLNQLLKEGERNFKNILSLKKETINFSNVVEKYLNQNQHLYELYTFLDNLNSTDNSPQTRKIIEAFEPKIVAYYNKTSLNKEYYTLLQKVFKQKLTKAQKRSTELLLKNMEIAGVALLESKRKQVEKINKELSKLSQKFVNNTIDSRKKFYFEFKDKKSLQEMPEAELHMAEQEAKQRKSKAKYVFTLSPPSLQAILKYCSDQSIREIFYKNAMAVAAEKPFDNRPLILKILKLRKQKAHILGFKNYADYILQSRMAKNTRQIESLLHKIHKKASTKYRQEIKQLEQFSGTEKIEEWDIAFYSEKYRQQKFKIDARKLKEFFPLDQVTKGLFQIAETLFGISLKPLTVKSYNSHVQIFEVWKDKQLLAYYLADFYARNTKKGGAWCNALRQGYLENKKSQAPIIVNVMNFSAPHDKTPSLLSHGDVETLFHEFGHALHLMFSSRTYANLNGFGTEWDFVEFPSQLLENWCWEMSSLKLFAKHYKTKKSLPASTVDRLKETKTFMSGYNVLRQLEFGLLDLYLHTHEVPQSVKKLDDICHKVVQKYSIQPKFKGYKFYTSFDHIFTGGYAAGYYSYIWAEILEADVYLTKMKKNILSPKVGKEYLEKVLKPGAGKKGSELFKDYVGREPKVEAFIQKHGLQ